MNKEHKYSTELLIDYVDGVLDPKTESRILSILENDEEARGIVAGIQTYYDVHGRDREGLDSFLSVIPNSGPLFGEQEIVPASEAKVRKLSGLAWKIVAAAAMITLIVTIWSRNDGPDRSELLAIHSENVYEFPAQTRGNDTAQDLFDYYNQGDFQSVVDLEKTVQLEDTQSMERLMIALSYFHVKDWPRAEEKLKLSMMEESRFTQHAMWHLALTYGNQNEWKKADPLLNQLVEENGYKSEQASELLQLLGD
jgi:hypothetical protein